MRYTVNLLKNWETNKIKHTHIDEIWSIDLADMIDYKIPNNNGLGYFFIVIDRFSKYTWYIPSKYKNSKTITDEFSNTSTKSKIEPVKLESDRGTEFYNSFFQNFLKGINIKLYSQLTDKCPSIAERVITTIKNLLKKLVFAKGNADWLGELSSVIKNILLRFTIQWKWLQFKQVKK